ncbi:MAG TPA: hypothetical protein VLM89_14095 [Phycisphaerae bacterium]|nr:hypothetical protein [Phycisphaerae bacterium]
MVLFRLHPARTCDRALRSESSKGRIPPARRDLAAALIFPALFSLSGVSTAQTAAPAPVPDSRWQCIPVEIMREDGSADRSNLYEVIALTNVQGRKVRDAVEAEMRAVSKEDLQRFFVLMARDYIISVNHGKLTLERLPKKPHTFDFHHEDLLEAQIETMRCYLKYMLERIRIGPPPTSAERTKLQQQIDLVCRELAAMNTGGEKDDVERLTSFVRSMGQELAGPLTFGDCFRPISDEALNTLLEELRRHAVVREAAEEMDSSSPTARHHAAVARFHASLVYVEQAQRCSKAFSRYPDSATPEQLQQLTTMAVEGNVAQRKVRNLHRRYYGDKLSATRPSGSQSQPTP